MQRDRGDHAERSFGADENTGEIIAGSIEHRRTEVNQLAGGQHHFERQHMRRGKAVLEAVRAAGVLGHIAADRADGLRRRVRRVEVSERRHLLRDVRVDDARLDDDSLIGNVDIKNAVHAGEADARCRSHPGALRPKARAGAASHEGNLMLRTDAHDRLHFRRRSRQHHRRRHRANAGRPSHSYVCSWLRSR